MMMLMTKRMIIRGLVSVFLIRLENKTNVFSKTNPYNDSGHDDGDASDGGEYHYDCDDILSNQRQMSGAPTARKKQFWTKSKQT